MILNVFSDEGFNESFKHIIDWIAVGTVISAFVGWLPSIAAAFTIVWTAIRIIESNTFQRLWNRMRGNGGALS